MDNSDIFEPFNNDHLREFLSDIKKNIPLMDEISKRSYLHVNNFYKINICKLDDGSTLRIHMWKLVDDKTQNPHSHGWDFESKILYGEVENSIFEKSDDGEEFTQYVQTLNRHTGSSLISPFGATKISKFSS